MGYDLIVRVAIEEDLTEQDLYDFNEDKGILYQMETKYEELRNEEMKIEIGKIVHTISGYYSNNSYFLEQIMLFTSAFSQYTFKIYYSVFDFADMDVYTIKGTRVLNQKSIEVIRPAKLNDKDVTLKPTFHPHKVSIRHEITSYLNYYYDFDYK